MPTTIDGVDFSLYRPDVFELLSEGQATPLISGDVWFNTAIALAYEQMAASFGCLARLSADRTEEARHFWKRDVKRIDFEGDTIPDQFKQAGFLAYWLRRRVTLNHVVRSESTSVSADLQTRFVKSGNEFCAFVVGFRICAFFVYGRLADGSDSLFRLMESINLEPTFLFDIAALLKNKNVSPHSLYVLYRALFYDLRLPPRDTVVRLVRR